METCETCHGTGAIGSPQTCPICGGTGTIQQAAGKMRFNVPCTRCGGTGKLRTVCKTCGGEGRVRRTETIDVRIPAGIASGSRVRVSGKGNAGTMGAPAGDFYLARRCEAACVFRTPRQRSLRKSSGDGERSDARLESGSPDDRWPLAGANSAGHEQRQRRCGCAKKACRARNGARGDEYVEIQVIVPKPTDERVRNLMKELEQIEPDDPRKDLFAKAGG